MKLFSTARPRRALCPGPRKAIQLEQQAAQLRGEQNGQGFSLMGFHKRGAIPVALRDALNFVEQHGFSDTP